MRKQLVAYQKCKQEKENAKEFIKWCNEMNALPLPDNNPVHINQWKIHLKKQQQLENLLEAYMCDDDVENIIKTQEQINNLPFYLDQEDTKLLQEAKKIYSLQEREEEK